MVGAAGFPTSHRGQYQPTSQHDKQGSDRNSKATVKAIVELSKGLGLDTVAEYVETDELRSRMTALGVDYGQGFAIGRPVPIDEILGDLALYEAMAQQEPPVVP